MNRLLILGILIILTAPLFAQAQQPDAAELAQNVVSIISGDKAKIQIYCQILDLSDELDQADQQKDREKAEALSQKINELQKKLGPEYLALLKATEHVDPNSKGNQEIVSNFVKLDNSWGQGCCSNSRIDFLRHMPTIQRQGLQPPQVGGSAPRRRGEGSRDPARDRCPSARGCRAPDRRLERAPGAAGADDLFAHDRRRLGF